jgi:hypothetical protein
MSAENKLVTDAVKFTSLLDDYAHFIDLAGHKVCRSTSNEAQRIFESLSHHRQTSLLGRLDLDVAILREARHEGDDLNETKRMLWRFLQKMKLSPCSDIFDSIQDGDVVELYSPEQVHLWQNMAFFDWCSVSLERIYTDTWYDATIRDPQHQSKLIECATQMFSSDKPQSIRPLETWHTIEEVDSELLLKFDLHVKVMSPVFQNRKVAGLILVNECREIQ